MEFADVSEAELSWRPPEGDWSLRQTAAHLRDAEKLALAQITAMVEQRPGALPF